MGIMLGGECGNCAPDKHNLQFGDSYSTLGTLHFIIILIHNKFIENVVVVF